MRTVAVFRGGTTYEHEHYYAASEPVYCSLRLTDRPHRDVIVTKDGNLLVSGKKRTIQQSLEGADTAMLLLPKTCSCRDQIEQFLRLSKLPSVGLRNSLDVTDGSHPHTTLLPSARTVSVFTVRDFRGRPLYQFPVLEQIAAERTMFNRVSWLSDSARSSIEAELQSREVPNGTALIRTNFAVTGDTVQLVGVQTSADLLFSPALKTSCDFVGLPYKSLINHLIDVSI